MTEDEYTPNSPKPASPPRRLNIPVYTVDQSTAIHDALPAAHTKNQFLKDKHKQLWLIVLPSDRRADLKAFAEQLGAGKFSFGKADEWSRCSASRPVR